MSKLTDKQEKEEKPLKPEWIVFCREYVKRWNQTDSYMVAYPKSTKKAATSSASELLTNPNITAYIEEIQKDLAKLAGISALSNIKHLTDILEAEGDNKEATKDRIAAVKVVNDMLGWNAPVKKDIRLDDNRISPEEREARIKKLQDRAKDVD
jgi:phage terminase small subunit